MDLLTANAINEENPQHEDFIDPAFFNDEDQDDFNPDDNSRLVDIANSPQDDDQTQSNQHVMEEEGDIFEQEEAEDDDLLNEQPDGKRSDQQNSDHVESTTEEPSNSGKPLETAIKDPIFKEMSYTVYGENLEACLKILSCMKTVSLIDKKDPKSRRMFITAQCQIPFKSAKSMKALREDLNTVQAYKT